MDRETPIHKVYGKSVEQNFIKQSNMMTEKQATTGATSVWKGFKLETNEAISYHGDRKRGGGVRACRTVSFGECHLQALMMIRAAAGVNNIGALKY